MLKNLSMLNSNVVPMFLYKIVIMDALRYSNILKIITYLW